MNYLSPYPIIPLRSTLTNPASLNIRIALDVDENAPQTLDMTHMYDMMSVSGTGGKDMETEYGTLLWDIREAIRTLDRVTQELGEHTPDSIHQAYVDLIDLKGACEDDGRQAQDRPTVRRGVRP